MFTAKLALPRLSSDTQRCHSPIPTGGESISSVPTRSSVQLLPVSVWLAWSGFAPFSPSSSPQSPLVDAASALVLLLRSCHRTARHTFSCSPPTGPPSSSSSPLPPFVQYFSFPLAHVLPRILVLTPQRIRRTPTGPAVHLSSLSAARQGVSGPRVVQPFIFTSLSAARKAYPDPEWFSVHLHSLPAARNASPDPGRSSRSSSVTIHCQEGVSGPRVVSPLIFTRYPLPGRRIRTPSGPAVHLRSLSAASKAYRDPEWSIRSSSLAIRRQEGVSGPRVVQPFIFTRYPPPGRRFRTASGPGVHLRSSIRLQEGVYGLEGLTVLLNSPSRRSDDAFGSRMVQSFSSARLSATR